MSEGAEILLTISISDFDGKIEKRKLLMFTEQYLELGLSKGMVIDEVLFDKLEEISKRCKAMKKGSDLLSYSASSERRLAQRLKTKGIDRESAEYAAAQLKKMGVINEPHDVERLVQAGLKKLWGKKRIYRDLLVKGYDRDIVSAELGSIDNEIFVENCRILFIKKFKKMPTDPSEQNKIVGSLMRYGYSFSEIKNAIERK